MNIEYVQSTLLFGASSCNIDNLSSEIIVSVADMLTDILGNVCAIDTEGRGFFLVTILHNLPRGITIGEIRRADNDGSII